MKLYVLLLLLCYLRLMLGCCCCDGFGAGAGDPPPRHRPLSSFFSSSNSSGRTRSGPQTSLRLLPSSSSSSALPPAVVTSGNRQQPPVLCSNTYPTKKRRSSRDQLFRLFETPPRGGGGGDGGSTSSADLPAQQHKQETLRRELLAEAFGTFLLVQIGTAGVMSAVYTESLVGIFQISFTWIVAVTAAIFVTAGISGAHLNPAISLALALVRPGSLAWRKVLPYWTAQLLGAALASAVNLFLYGSTIRAFEAAHGIVRSSSQAVASARGTFGQYFGTLPVAEAFGVEVWGTFVLAAVVFAATHPDNRAIPPEHRSFVVPPLIGCTVGALICTLGPLTQAGFNPARDLGPRLVAWGVGGWSPAVAFRRAWLYLVAPLVGAVLGAAFVDKILFRRRRQDPEDKTR